MAEVQDAFGRTINYLRLSITDLCNLRCQYCMPAEGIDKKSCNEILSYEDFLCIVQAATALGVRKVRVTGGEPLVRNGAIGFIQRLGEMPKIDEIALTTNGLLLGKYAADLANAGIKRLNVSLDSLNRQTYAEITRGGSLEKVLEGLSAAEAAGLKIKLNMVAMRGVNDQEILDFAALSLDKPWAIRFIEYMPTIGEKDWRQHLISGAEILQLLSKNFKIESISSGQYCGPAKPYRIAGAQGSIGIITPMSEHFCGSCNRIRVTANGFAKSCLLSEGGLDLKPFLQTSMDELTNALRNVMLAKPQQHHFNDDQQGHSTFSMSSIGG